ncbi:winged helix-turn-helix domain-containing protein [Ancylobacter amanitiformis]|uniref:Molybdate transport system regulatory protein n=1 Tax=Ancylobacter amanitiformis TaxID=217069 RepID=A0ABU0LW08_9HYPH|nr:LysR family transcriptional regulator [Ancylobacter amanitiformis]MDQ0512852.1 molybdate transport system regulatory protein [Ancylobacter amanitiformis]
MAPTDIDDIPGRPARARDGLFIRVYFGDGRHIGPGMIDLLETIRRERSILSAARHMGMSYRRAWLLVDAMARTFREPVVETHPGRRGAGTNLTAFGERLIALYRGIEQSSAAASRAAMEELRAGLAPLPVAAEAEVATNEG